MSKLPKEAMARRDRVETMLVRGTTARRRLAMALLRCRQAVDRVPVLGDLLRPAIDDLAAVRQEIVEIQEALEQVWQEGEAVGWRVIEE